MEIAINCEALPPAASKEMHDYCLYIIEKSNFDSTYTKTHI